MASPFGSFTNATLTLETPSDNVVEVNGNWVAETTTTTYKALLKPSRPSTNREIGIDSSMVYLSGYLTDPMYFPEAVKLPLKVACTVKMQNGSTQSGELFLDANISTGFNVEGVTGQKIQGYLKIQDGN